jgi:hypothetical protein
MSSDPDQIREQIEETRVSLSHDVNTLTDKVNPAHATRRTAARVSGAVRSSRDKVMGTTAQSAASARSMTGDALSGASGKAAEARRAARRQTQGNPLAAGLIAVGIGWLAGSLLPASSVEEQVAAKAKETATPAVTEAARETAASLQGPAHQAAESVKTATADAAATVKDESVSSAQDVRDQALAARDAVSENRQ